MNWFYYFNINGLAKKAFIPKDYSAMSSQYDRANDLMYVFARKDTNQNGQAELTEPIEIFWIDVKHPENFGKQYQIEWKMGFFRTKSILVTFLLLFTFLVHGEQLDVETKAEISDFVKRETKY